MILFASIAASFRLSRTMRRVLAASRYRCFSVDEVGGSKISLRFRNSVCCCTVATKRIALLSSEAYLYQTSYISWDSIFPITLICLYLRIIN